MNDLLHRTLTDLAESAPVARVGDDTWRRGRRRRRVVQATMAVLAVAAVLPVGLVVGRAEPAAVKQEQVVVPSRMSRPSPAQSTLDDSPNGPVVAAFASNITLRFGFAATSGVALVGRDGSYRFLPMSVDDPWLLSPDGRYLARPGELVDLTDAGREPIPEASTVLAWDLAGKLLLYMDRSDVYLRDVEAHTHRKLFARQDNSPRGIEAAFSPDGTRVAITWDSRLRVFDVQSGAEQWSVATVDGVLAGPAAWMPDSRRVMLLRRFESRWELGFADGTGRAVWEQDQQRTGHPHGVVGWRDGEPVWVMAGTDYETVVALVRVPLSGGQPQRLLGVESGPLQVPRDLVERADFTSPPVSPGLGDIPWSYFVLAGALLLALALLVVFLIRRAGRHALP